MVTRTEMGCWMGIRWGSRTGFLTDCRTEFPMEMPTGWNHQRMGTLMEIPMGSWHTVRWREGTRGTMESRFATVRVRPAHRDETRSEPSAVEWLLIEWPPGESEPTKHWLSTVPAHVAVEELVRLAKIRWRIERDSEEMKGELGLGHYEGRGWLGFHHHGVLCIAAYAFLAAERARLSPPEPLAFLRAPRLPKSFRPRGTPAAS